MPLHLLTDPEQAKLLLNADADPNARTMDGQTPLHCIAQGDHSETVQALCNSGADPNARNSDGQTPLHLAVENSDHETVRILLDAGANPNARDKDGWTPLHVVNREGIDDQPDEEIKEAEILIKSIWALLDAGTDPNARADNGDTPLLAAVRTVQDTDNQGMLDDPDVLDAPDTIGRALSVSTKERPTRKRASRRSCGWIDWVVNVPAKVQALLDAGADPNARGEDGWAPLHIVADDGGVHGLAEIKSLLKISRILLDAGADPNIRLDGGWTPLHIAAHRRQPMAVMMMHALLDADADPNTRTDDGWTPLHIAAQNRDPVRIQALLDAGADAKAKTEEGLIPWDLVQDDSEQRDTPVYWRLHDGRFE